MTQMSSSANQNFSSKLSISPCEKWRRKKNLWPKRKREWLREKQRGKGCDIYLRNFEKLGDGSWKSFSLVETDLRCEFCPESVAIYQNKKTVFLEKHAHEEPSLYCRFLPFYSDDEFSQCRKFVLLWIKLHQFRNFCTFAIYQAINREQSFKKVRSCVNRINGVFTNISNPTITSIGAYLFQDETSVSGRFPRFYELSWAEKSPSARTPHHNVTPRNFPSFTACLSLSIPENWVFNSWEPSLSPPLLAILLSLPSARL